MADQSDIRCKAEQAAGQAQMKEDEMMNRASEACQQGEEQAGGMLHQVGNQIRNLPRGAADAAKHAVGTGGHSNDSATSNPLFDL